MLIALFLLPLDRFPLFQNRARVARIALAKNVRMSPDQFFGDLSNDIVDLESAGFAGDLRVHHNQEQKIPELFAKMRVIL